MAGGRDIKRETLRIREEQRERNRKAVEDRERRVSEAERERGFNTRGTHRRRTSRSSGVTIRRGHRVIPVDNAPEHVQEDYEKMLRSGDVEDKMDRGDAVQDKALDPGLFASDTALELAIERDLTPDDLMGVEPSGKTGLTAADVRSVKTRGEEAD